MGRNITIEIRRHALKGNGTQKDLLSPEGVEQAREIGKAMEGKSFTHIVVSPYFRTAQTAAAFAEGAGDFTAAKLMISTALFSQRMNEWIEYHKDHGGKVIPNHPFIIQEANRMRQEFQELLASLPEDSHILCVGHTPFLECLIFGLTDEVIAPLTECEGVEIQVLENDEVGFRLDHQFRYPYSLNGII